MPTTQSQEKPGHCQSWLTTLICVLILCALPHLGEPSLTEATEIPDPVAASDDRPSLGLRHDPSFRIDLPRWDALMELRRENYPSGIPLSARLHPVAHFRAPYDIAKQGRVPLEFCSGYWPEHQPERTVEEFCAEDYYTYWPLFQGMDENPFRIARDQAEYLNNNEAVAERRWAWALAHWWVNGRDVEAAAAAVTAALYSEDRVKNGTLIELQLEQVLRLLPESVWEVVPQEGSCPIDLRVSSSLSHDSTVNTSELLRTADKRQLDGVVVADRGHIAGAQRAQDIAGDLKNRGELRPDFQVLTGEHITCAGGVSITAIGTTSRIVEGMTLNRTIKEVHQQGGVAIMNHPGDLGGLPLLRRLDVDGYFIQPRLFELFRTMSLLHDPALVDQPALYASHARYSQLAGLPYSEIIGEDCSNGAVTSGIAQGEAYAASNLYFPLMAFMLIEPIAYYQKGLNSYFRSHEWLTEQLRDVLDADHVILQTTWDRSIRNLMSLDMPAWDEVDALRRGSSPLLDGPEVISLAAQWGDVHVSYAWKDHAIWMTSRLQF